MIVVVVLSIFGGGCWGWARWPGREDRWYLTNGMREKMSNIERKIPWRTESERERESFRECQREREKVKLSEREMLELESEQEKVRKQERYREKE